MIFDLMTLSQGVGPKLLLLLRPIYVSNSHTKFGWMSSNGKGGDGIMDRQTDGWTEAIKISIHF